MDWLPGGWWGHDVHLSRRGGYLTILRIREAVIQSYSDKTQGIGDEYIPSVLRVDLINEVVTVTDK